MRKIQPVSFIPYLVFCLISFNAGAVQDSGDVLEIGNDLMIGNTAFGQRIYEFSDGAITKDNTRLGNAPGVRGELICEAQFYTNNSAFEVGNAGEGSLDIYSTTLLTTHQLVVGKEAGSDGEVRTFFTNIDVVGPGSFGIIGDAGVGRFLIGSGGDAPATATFDSLTLGAQPGGDGFVRADVGSLIVGPANGNARLIVGKAGTGWLTSDSRASVSILGPAAHVELGMEPGANGTISIESGGGLAILDNDGTLIIGGAGTGTVARILLSPLGFATGTTGGKSFVAMLPGSIGTVNIGDEGGFFGGELLRIGLDVQDNPGGTGLIELAGFEADLRADLIKIGPDGTLKTTCSNCSIVGSVENQGRLSGPVSIVGNVANSGVVDAGTSFRPSNASSFSLNDFTQIAAGTIKMAVDPVASITFGRVNASGAVDIDGLIEVDFLSEPDPGQVFNLILAGNIVFSPALTIMTTGLPSYLAVSPRFGSGNLGLEIVDAGLEADVAVSQSDSPDPVKVGASLTYSVSVSNGGPGITDITLVDTLPQDSNFVSVEPDALCTPSVGKVTCSVSGLAPTPGSNEQLFTVTVAPTGPGSITNTVSLVSSAVDPNPADNSSSESTTVEDNVFDLAVSVSDSLDPVIINSELAYLVTVVNNGPDIANDTNVSIDLPDDALFVSAVASQGICNGIDPLSCDLAALNSGSSASIDARVRPQAVGTISTVAIATAIGTDSNAANNTAVESTTVEPVPLPVADLSITMSDSPDPAKHKKDLLYTITVTNTGPDSASDVVITDVFPDIFALQSATPSQGTCTGTGPVVCNVGELPLGASAILDVLVTPQFGGTWVNTATTGSGAQDPNTGNNSVTESTTVRGRPFRIR